MSTDTRLADAAQQHADALRAAEDTRNRLRRAVAAACNAGMSEAEAARRAGVTRMTIRAWRGKAPTKGTTP